MLTVKEVRDTTYKPRFKEGAPDTRYTDEPFVFTVKEDEEDAQGLAPISFTGCPRGKWELTKFGSGFGFFMEGFGGENQIVATWSFGQSGTVKIMVNETSVDLGQWTEILHVRWADFKTALNDLINIVYFHR